MPWQGADAGVCRQPQQQRGPRGMDREVERVARAGRTWVVGSGRSGGVKGAERAGRWLARDGADGVRGARIGRRARFRGRVKDGWEVWLARMVGVRGVITGLGRDGRRALASLAVGKARAGARAGWVGGSRGGVGYRCRGWVFGEHRNLGRASGGFGVRGARASGIAGGTGWDGADRCPGGVRWARSGR